MPGGNKVEDLISRVAALEALLALPPGDVAEQRRRGELIWYGPIPFLGSVLSSSQQAQGHRESTAIIAREAGAASTCGSRSRR